MIQQLSRSQQRSGHHGLGLLVAETSFPSDINELFGDVEQVGGAGTRQSAEVVNTVLVDDHHLADEREQRVNQFDVVFACTGASRNAGDTLSNLGGVFGIARTTGCVTTASIDAVVIPAATLTTTAPGFSAEATSAATSTMA